MALETGDYINDLVITNPTSSDPKSQGDDHFQLIKKVLKECLNGFTGGILLTATETGTASAHVLTPTTALVGYTTGLMLLYRPTNAGTGALTVNVSGLGAKSVKTIAGADPTSGDILVNQPILLMYDGTNFVLLAGSEYLSKTGNQTLTGNLTLTGDQTVSGTLAVTGATTFTGDIGGTGGNKKANLASPTFTGTPTAPTATVGTSTTQIATTAFVAATGLSTALPGQSGNAGKFITTDGTNASWVDPFAPGTAMLFAQTAAPTGWTKSTTHNDKALRVVSGTAGSGGSTAFTTVFASRTPAGSVTVDGTTLTESQMPAHTHTTSAYNSHGTGSYDPGGSSAVNYLSAAIITSSSIGGGGSHTHTGSFTGTAMDFAVQYVDVIIATKD